MTIDPIFLLLALIAVDLGFVLGFLRQIIGLLKEIRDGSSPPVVRAVITPGKPERKE